MTNLGLQGSFLLEVLGGTPCLLQLPKAPPFPRILALLSQDLSASNLSTYIVIGSTDVIQNNLLSSGSLVNLKT